MRNVICVLLHQIGPYHHARLNALARRFDVLAVEIRATSTEYYWTNLDHGVCNYSVVRAQGKAAIVNVFKQHSIDFFLTYGWNEPEYLQTILYAKKNRQQVFMASDSIEIASTRNIIKHFIKRKIAQSIDGFLVAGKRSEAYIRYYVPQAIIEKPFDVVDNAHFENYGNYNPNGYLLCVARLIEKKNIIALVDAVSLIKEFFEKYNTKLLIVGSGLEQNSIESAIKSHNLSNLVTLENWKSYEELPALYHNAQALILPSLYGETWGLVVNEALSAGLPILLSNKCGCLPELLHEGDNGFSFNPSRIDISKTVKQYLNLAVDEKRGMSKKSKAIVSHYEINNHVDAVQNLLAKTHIIKLGLFNKSILQLISFLKK